MALFAALTRPVVVLSARSCCNAQRRAVQASLPTSSGRFMATRAGLLDGLGSLFSKKSTKPAGKNDDLLRWARTATRACKKAPATAPEGLEIATFAGGCFWGLELAFQRLHGVTHTSVGYTQGEDLEPTYEKVCSGRTGHTEAVQVYYDPNVVSYERLLEEFFAKTDPTTLNRQGNDRGTQYRSGIYYHNEAQKEKAEQYIAKVNEELKNGSFRQVWGDEVVSELKPATDYYEAENYHQQYLSKGGRMGFAQSAEKGCTDPIRCYG